MFTIKTSLLALCGISLLATPSFAYEMKTSETMAETARRFLASLNEDQKKQATFAFENEERVNWHFIPRERKGLALKDMEPYQKNLAGALLSAGLSQRGYIKARTIMSLEEILKIMEKDNGVRRNPEGYYFSVFGEPSETGTWGYRVEGHHVATNFTIVKGKATGGPNFFGANPAEVREGPRKGLRALAAEEDLGRELIKALTPEQKQTAIVAKEAYKDIITMNSRVASMKGQAGGLQASKMNANQKTLLQSLLAEYANNLPESIAADRLARIKKAGTNIYFAWAGGENRGDPHYYRVQGPDFLVEYDNTQNNANHIHSVWRDLNGDFGDDLLKTHYETTHNKGDHNH